MSGIVAVLLSLIASPIAWARSGGDRGSNPPSPWSELSPEVQELIAGTVLQRDLPAPTESPRVIRRYLRLGAAERLDAEAYVRLMRRTVGRWPESRLAHAGLAEALQDDHGGSPSPEDLRSAATHLLAAAELSFQEGRVRYQDAVAELLPRVGAQEEAEAFFEHALKVAREDELYVTHLAFADVLALSGQDERADGQYEAAIAVRPDDLYGAYERYSVHLMKTDRYQRVLDLLAPEVVNGDAILYDFFLGMRCRAARSLGSGPETVPDCRKPPPQRDGP